VKHNALGELRSLSVPELERKAKETKEELFTLRFALRTGHLTDFSKVRETRRSYAQIQTVICEKKITERDGAA